jgi:hypothetical protein
MLSYMGGKYMIKIEAIVRPSIDGLEDIKEALTKAANKSMDSLIVVLCAAAAKSLPCCPAAYTIVHTPP